MASETLTYVRTAARADSSSIRGTLIGVALAVTAAVAAVSYQSAWIDEASTGLVARQPTLAAWWQLLTTMKGSDLQMPFYMAYVWVCEKLVGSSELTLRQVGLVWLIPGVAVFASSFRTGRERLMAGAVIASSAFLWYYANEARPYGMQVGVSCLIVGALHRLTDGALSTRQQGIWLAVFAFGLVALSGSSMLGMIWVPAALAAALVLVPAAERLAYWRKYRVAAFGVSACLLMIGLFYVWTLTLGARASDAARTDAKTVAYIFYEQLGFSGLGPGRADLRQSAAQALLSYVPFLAIYSLLLATVFAAAFAAIRRSTTVGRVAALAGVIAAPAALLIAAALVTHFRLLGRHWAPLMPIWFMLLTIGAVSLWERRGWMGKAAVGGFLAISLWSCLELRFAARHAHDDYRSAAGIATAALAADETVWWNAAEVGGLFYHVPLSINAEERAKGSLVNSPLEAGTAVLMFSPEASSLATLPAPDVIITSKADIYDSTGTVAEYIAARSFRRVATLAAFSVWRPDDKRNASGNSDSAGSVAGTARAGGYH